MSLGYPTLRPTPNGDNHNITQKEGPYGVPDILTHGQCNAKSEIQSAHPLEYSEQHYRENQDKMDAVMLRNLQGVHAPLKLQMERQTALKVGRLPGMHSSNLMAETLSGQLDTVDFEDVLTSPWDHPAEVMGQTHAIMEKRLGLL